MLKWDRRFLNLAKLISTFSKDPSTKVGAVIVDSKNRLVSTGYNGFPRGVSDNEELLNDRDEKYIRIIHAELNAILFARKDLSGNTLYSWPFQPCGACASIIIQCEIARVVSVTCDIERWKKSFEIANVLFKEASVNLCLYDPSQVK